VRMEEWGTEGNRRTLYSEGVCGPRCGQARSTSRRGPLQGLQGSGTAARILCGTFNASAGVEGFDP
jgi:hypothetical protein